VMRTMTVDYLLVIRYYEGEEVLIRIYRSDVLGSTGGANNLLNSIVQHESIDLVFFFSFPIEEPTIHITLTI
jgi:hypothetical protein